MKELAVLIVIVALLFGALLLGALFTRAVMDIRSIEQLTGHSVASLQQLKQECEKNIPRSKECVIVVSAQVKGDE